MTPDSVCANCGKIKDKHIDYFGTGKKDCCPNRKSMKFVPKNTSLCECDCHLFVGGSGNPCPNCIKEKCWIPKKNENNQQPLKSSEKNDKSYEVEKPHPKIKQGQGEITSSGMEDHLPRVSPADKTLEKEKSSDKILSMRSSPELKINEKSKWKEEPEKKKKRNKEYYQENKERLKGVRNKRYLRKKEEVKDRTRKWRKENPEKLKVQVNNNYNKRKEKEDYKLKRSAENKARSKIKIPKGQLCELCKVNLATERHHPNYDEPLKVEFLCSDCHHKIHRKYKEQSK